MQRKKVSNINLGNLYDINKQIVATEKPLSNTDLKRKLREIKSYFFNTEDKYFMLLNRENYDFTLFNTLNKTDLQIQYLIDALKECLNNRGEVISIDCNGTAFEFWIKQDLTEETVVYYLFPYDQGVIEYE